MKTQNELIAEAAKVDKAIEEHSRAERLEQLIAEVQRMKAANKPRTRRTKADG